MDKELCVSYRWLITRLLAISLLLQERMDWVGFGLISEEKELSQVSRIDDENSVGEIVKPVVGWI